MIEANNPDVNVDELMSKVREEVARRKRGEVPLLSSAGEKAPAHEEPLGVIDASHLQTHLQQHFHAAEHYVEVGSFVPSWNQYGWGRRVLSRLIARSVLFVSSFLTNWQTDFNRAIVQAGRGLANSLSETLSQTEQRLNGFGEQAQQQHDELRRLDRSLRSEVQRLEDSLDGVRQTLTADRGQVAESLSGVKSELLGEVEALRQTFAADRGQVEESLGRVKSELLGEVEALRQTVVADRTQADVSLTRVKRELLAQERRVAMLLEEARKRLPEPFDTEQLQVLATEDSHRLEALYLSLEDEFRGGREDIKDRLTVYLPILKKADLGTQKMPILDIGCGRGEFLEVLQDEGLVARGVDTNRVLVEQCQERGLAVVEGDGLAYLGDMPDTSLGAVSVIHLIEHLPFLQLVGLVDEIVRVLKPGGVAIFETPNPSNLLVSSHNFYIDPTHRHPLPSAVVQFLAEARGLCRVTVKNLHPYPSTMRLSGSEVAERLSDYLYGPQDYAVIGWKV